MDVFAELIIHVYNGPHNLKNHVNLLRTSLRLNQVEMFLSLGEEEGESEDKPDFFGARREEGKAGSRGINILLETPEGDGQCSDGSDIEGKQTDESMVRILLRKIAGRVLNMC